MTRYLIVTAAALALTGSASAQYTPSPFFRPPGAMPNVFDPRYQPLSPYLNLARGGNPAVNYYYGVRPGTVGGTGQSLGAPFTAAGANRPLFFPQLAGAPDPLEEATAGPGAGLPGAALPPAGHPVVFNNTGGYFPGG